MPALRVQAGVRPEDSFPELLTHRRDECLGTTPLLIIASMEEYN